MDLKWELLDEDAANGIRTERVRVPDGWLVRCYTGKSMAGVSSASLTFVPDPLARWDEYFDAEEERAEIEEAIAEFDEMAGLDQNGDRAFDASEFDDAELDDDLLDADGAPNTPKGRH